MNCNIGTDLDSTDKQYYYLVPIPGNHTAPPNQQNQQDREELEEALNYYDQHGKLPQKLFDYLTTKANIKCQNGWEFNRFEKIKVGDIRSIKMVIVDLSSS